MKQEFKQMSIVKYSTHETMLMVEIDDKNMIILHRWMRCGSVNEINCLDDIFIMNELHCCAMNKIMFSNKKLPTCKWWHG
jgi:hypothetical protein